MQIEKASVEQVHNFPITVIVVSLTDNHRALVFMNLGIKSGLRRGSARFALTAD